MGGVCMPSRTKANDYSCECARGYYCLSGCTDADENPHKCAARVPAPTPNVAFKRLTHCLSLSVASSLDNLAVGFSLGMLEAELPRQLNLIVSFCNAAGAFGSSFVGVVLGTAAPGIAGLFAAGIFGRLGFSEMSAFWNDEESVLAALALEGNAWKLALPMTLNNVAGGVAGGLAGVGPLQLTAGGFLASFALMWSGHAIGRYIQQRQRPAAVTDAEAAKKLQKPPAWLDARVLGAAVFFGLAYELMGTWVMQ